MNINLHKNISREKAVKLLGNQYSPLLPKELNEPLTIMIFRDSVVKSKKVEKGLKRIEANDESTLIMAARNFTEEAILLGKERRAVILSTASSIVHWTDSSHERIKVLIGANTKKPDIRARKP